MKNIGKKRQVCYFAPAEIANISEQDFWSHIRTAKRNPGAEHLAQAIALGKAGKKSAAYRKLAEYHKQSLGKEIAFIRSEADSSISLFGMDKVYPETGNRRLGAGTDQETMRRVEKQRCEDVTADLLKGKVCVSNHKYVLSFETKIDWNACGAGSDIVFSLLSLHWLEPAIKHLALTGDERTGRWLQDIVISHYAARNRIRICDGFGNHDYWKNHPLYNWRDSYTRTMALSCAYAASLGAGAISPKAVEAFMKVLLGLGRALQFGPGQSKGWEWAGNGAIIATGALFRLGVLFPEFSESSSWVRESEDRLLDLLKQEYFADGGYRERTLGYGCLSFCGFITAWEAAQRHGGFARHGTEITRRLRKAIRWYAKVIGPNHVMPSYGDCGPKGLEKMELYGRLKTVFPEHTGDDFGVDRGKSYLLKPSGFAVMRDGDKPDSGYVNINFGKFAGWHSHFDLLSLNYWSHGAILVEELGRWGPYAGDLDGLFHAPESHNLFLIDGWIYDCRPEGARDIRWHSTPRLDYFSAYHRAYRYRVFLHDGPGSPNRCNALVRRTAVFVKDPGYLLVLDSAYDEATGASIRGAVSQFWHSPYKFARVDSGSARTLGKVACLFVFADPKSLKRMDVSASFAGDEVEVETPYPPDRYTLRARRWRSIKERAAPGFATVLYPFAGKMPKVSIRTLPTENGMPYRAEGYEIRTPRGRDVILLNPERIPGIRCERRNLDVRAHITLGGGRGDVAIH